MTEFAFLNPEEIKVSRTEHGGLQVVTRENEAFANLKLRRCYPFSHESRFISLHKENDEAIGIIKDVAELDVESRKIIESELTLQHFLPRILSIQKIKTRPSGSEWLVETDRGDKQFIVRGGIHALMEVSTGCFILSDINGSRYELRPERLDPSCRRKIRMLM